MQPTKWLPAAISLAALSAPVGHALAQSSVTLYGVVDLGLNFAKSGPTSLTRLEDEGRNHSRIGLRGTEDLGDGLKTLFVLEGSVFADTGRGTGADGGLQFNRQSYVALESTRWGRVSAGRMYTPQFIATSMADPYEVNSRWSPMLLMYSSDAQNGLQTYAARGNNMIRWRSPSDEPWYVDLGYSFGEVSSPNRNNGRMYSGALGWNEKPYLLLYGFQKATEGSTANPVPSPRVSFSQSISARWDVNDVVRLYGNYVINKLERSPVDVGDAKIGSVAGHWLVTPKDKLIANIAHRKVDGSPRKQTSWSLGYDHSLSSRTYLYARWRQLRNGGNSSVSIVGIPIVADSGDSVRSVTFGIRHAF